MKILITGATGLIGKEIIKQCHIEGISVHFLTTSKAKLSSKENEKGFLWNPSKGAIDLNAFQGVTHIINLAGSTIAQRWTEKNKAKILHSRLDSINTLMKGIRQLESHSLTYFLGASAIGYYPSDFSKEYPSDWHSESGKASFLRETVLAWEAANESVASLGLKLGQLRIGLVLDQQEGALPQFVTPIKNFVGAAFGNGKQWQSWIHKEDIARMFLSLSKNELEGVFNGVAPNPVIQKELVAAIAQQLNKPVLLPNVPGFVISLILGEMAQLVLESQKVQSDQWLALGFEFHFPTLPEALRDLL